MSSRWRKTRRALDSTIPDERSGRKYTVTQLIAAIRRIRWDVTGAVDVIAAHCTAHDDRRPGEAVDRLERQGGPGPPDLFRCSVMRTACSGTPAGAGVGAESR
jgi:hypothetical protein